MPQQALIVIDVQNDYFADGKLDLKDLYSIANENGELNLQSGKQELFEAIINQHI